MRIGNGHVGLSLRAGATLATTGAWVNDRAARAAGVIDNLGPLALNGGKVALNATGNLDLEQGSLIDVSGGAQKTSTGSLIYGNAGTIELTSDDVSATRLTVAGNLRAYGFVNGGQLKMTGGGFAIRDGAVAVADMTTIAPALFGQAGFAGLQFTATRMGITVAPHTAIDLRQMNRIADKRIENAVSGTAVDALSDIGYLPDAQRRPTTLSLSFKRGANLPLALGEVSLGTGARLNADPGSTISLSSDTRMALDGPIDAPAGQIALSLIRPRDGNDRGFDPSQAITLGPHAALLARGAVTVIPNVIGTRQGSVRGGGSITVIADRGYVLANHGSVLDVSGTAAVFDLRDPARPTRLLATTVNASGGRIDLAAAEGMRLNGALVGHAGASLTLALDPLQRETSADLTGFTFFPTGPRAIVVGAAAVPDLPSAQAVPAVSNGLIDLPLQPLLDGGFSALSLMVRPAQIANGIADIRFVGDQSLRLPQLLRLDAPVLATTGGTVTLAAPYIRLGNTNAFFRDAALPTAGSGKLRVNAQLIDLIGDTSLQGFGAGAQFSSSGDLRLIGTRVPANQSSEFVGSLAALGDLSFDAARIYPTTLSQFVINSGKPGGRVAVTSAQANTQLPLSAGGSVTVVAANIAQGGVLLAPFGAIDLRASDTLVLGPGSLTSTSSANLLIPFGQTQFGQQWVYPLGTVTRIIDAVPAKRIALTAPNVSIALGATVDLSGGGDLLASEHIPGPGGSTDILAGANNSGAFAIVPTLNSLFAPYDPLEAPASGLAANATIELAGLPGLPAGHYAVLPARYAVLPGALLLTPVISTQAVVPGLDGQISKGLPVVAGRLGHAGEDLPATEWHGYRLETAADWSKRAEYSQTLASKFFGTKTAATRGLPADAGTLSLAASKTLALSGKLQSTTPVGGHGAALDIAADHLAVVAQLTGATDRVEIRASDLNGFGAQSLLLGGNRRAVGDETAIDVSASDVTLTNGVELTLPELLVTAHDNIVLETGAAVSAQGAHVTRDRPLALTGDGAFLLASTGAQATVRHSGQVGAVGSIDLRAGATVSAPGALALDGSRGTVVSGSLLTDQGSLRLASSRISLGAVDSVSGGLVLSNAKLDLLRANEWIFDSRSTVDVYGPLTAQVANLTINAAGIRGRDNAHGTVLLSADNVRLSNPTARSGLQLNAAPIADGSIFTIDAHAITLGPGALTLAGFAQADLQARADINGLGTASVATRGDLTITANRVTAASAADLAVDAHHVTFTRPSTPATLPATASLGGRIKVTAADIDFGGQVELPAGELFLSSTAAGGITVRAGAAINLAGTVESFGGKQVDVPGGRLQLQADLGSIAIETGALIDVSASGDGDGGRMALAAINGTINLAPGAHLLAQSGTRGSGFSLDATALGMDTPFSSLNALLNVAGFDGQRAFRLRSGDVTLAADATIRAQDLSITTDAGAIDIAGTLDAHGASAGRIALNAHDNLSLRGSARLDASATGLDQPGGEVFLSTTNGRLDLATTATAGAVGIDVAGTAATLDSHGATVRQNNGTVVLRAPRVNNGEVAVSSAAVTIDGAERVVLEAFKAYTGTDVATALAPALSDANSFMSHAASIEARLARNADPLFHLLPGIEIDSNSTLTLQATLDLLPHRFDGEPGVLTLRARGDVLINGTLTDGVAQVPFIDPASGEAVPELGERDTVQMGPSWSYHLVAGADPASADLHAVRAGVGNVVIAANHQVRTGSGTIAVATGGELRFVGSGSALYTAGENRGAGTFDPILTEGLLRADFLDHGGNLWVDARSGIRGVATPVLPDWIARMGGRLLQLDLDVPTAWAVKTQDFPQGIAALGGGRVVITTAGDLTDVNVAIPTTGQPSLTADGAAAVAIAGGGSMDIEVGGSIHSGTFLLGKGTAHIVAGGNIDKSTVEKSTVAPLGTVLELGDGRIDMTARGSLRIESIFNPTLTPVSPTQSAEAFGRAPSIFFSTYTAHSAVSLTALGGDTVLDSSAAAIRAPYDDRNFDRGELQALTLAPGSLLASSLRGDVQLTHSLVLAPLAQGQLEVLADGSLRSPDVETQIRLTDVNPLLIPSPAAPIDSLDGFADALISELPGVGHAAVPLHTGDLTLARVVARHGDIGSNSSRRLTIDLAKQALIEAGNDILNLSFTDQHVSASDNTVIRAGRDVRFSTLRNGLGVLQLNQARFQFNGPGQFDVLAGRDVDLGTSDGILSAGRLRNPAVPTGEGALTVMAGLAAGPDFSAFTERYVQGSHGYDSQLDAFIVQHPGSSSGTARTQLQNLPVDTQRAFLLSVFFDEIKASGIAASRAGVTASDYSRGFAAIHTLFPQAQGSGDIISLLSRISTLDGGDINLLAPYGLANAGAAVVTGLAKSADELGIVIQRSGNLNAFTARDFLVNSSRVFALDGGSILIWSSHGNIDAGRGAKSALSIPPPVVSFDALGNVITEFPPAVSGSGIQAAVSTAGRSPGDVFLFAPGGVVDAGDAGITSAGNLTIAATAVLGADNISVGGVASGVPTTTVSVPVGLAGASAAASSASNAATDAAAQTGTNKDNATNDLAKSWVSVISVEFLGFGN